MVFSARAATKDVARSRRRRTCTSPRSSSTLPMKVLLPRAGAGVGIAEVQTEPVVEPDGVTDDFRRESVAVVAGGRAGHQRGLREHSISGGLSTS